MFRKKVPKLERQQVLQAIPIRNPKLEVGRTEEGFVVLTLPLRQDWVGKLLAGYHRFIFWGKPMKPHKVELDELGSEVFDLIDGERTVDDLIKALAKKHKLARREVEVSLTEYLKTLGRRGIIAFAVPQDTQPESGEQEKPPEA